MTPQELRNSILQLAIQGRLVEQRPAEGTAQELYALIRAEQRRLIQEGRLRKRKPLPEITEEEKPFDLPESWMWVRHNALLEIIGGSQPPKSSFLDTEREGYANLFAIFIPKRICTIFISGASPIEKRNLMLPCVLHSERKRGTYPRFKTYSDLWQRKNSNFEMIPREVPQGTY